jgi:hypothetical protein
MIPDLPYFAHMEVRRAGVWTCLIHQCSREALQAGRVSGEDRLEAGAFEVKPLRREGIWRSKRKREKSRFPFARER